MMKNSFILIAVILVIFWAFLFLVLRISYYGVVHFLLFMAFISLVLRLLIVGTSDPRRLN
ncbi:hypothetical protein EMST110833_10995 [Empedobacter stercoris]